MDGSGVPLSKRMERLASLVTEGNRLADVGTDHGYVPIALVLRGRIPSAVAMDVRDGPLGRAKEHIRAYGLSGRIKTRLSDGLQGLMAGEADTVLIAGMGGELTARILSGGAHCLPEVDELVLQPQSEIFLVRRWLSEHGFLITDEDVVLDCGKYYPMFRAVHGQEEPLSEAEFFYGKYGVCRSPETLGAYLEALLCKNRAIRARLHGQKHEGRLTELSEEEARLMEALHRVR